MGQCLQFFLDIHSGLRGRTDSTRTPYVWCESLLRTPQERAKVPFMATKREIREYFAKFGKLGGQARAQNMTPQQRSTSARKAVEARWAKRDEGIAAALKEIKRGTKALLKKSRAAHSRRTKRKMNASA